MIIYQWTLGSHLQANAFEDFARKRYLPALHAGRTRAGQWHSIRLLRRSREHASDPLDLGRQFLLLIEWSGIPIDLPRVDDPTVQKQFDAFLLESVRLGSFDTIKNVINEEA
jgi:hypothetical protein